MPFVLATWFFLGALLQFTTIDVSSAIKPTSPSDFTGSRPDYTWITWFHGITMGIAEIFFQDNWVTGVIILIGIAVNTRIGALMALMGSTLAVGTAVFYGAHDEAIRDGLFGYNAALTAMALGGFFLVLNLPALIYTVIGVLVTARVWASLGIFLEPSGMPVLTSAFVFVTWLMLLAASGFQLLTPVAGGGHDSGRQSSPISNGSEKIDHFERKRGLITGGTAAYLKDVAIRLVVAIFEPGNERFERLVLQR